MTNIEVQAVIPDEYSSWISVEQTRNLNFDYVTLNVAFIECENLTSIALPESLREIHSEAFKGCSSLISVEIPDSVTRIDDSVFFQCVSLTEVVIGKGVTYIGDEAFRHCLMLDNIYCKPTTPPEGNEYMFDQIGPKAAIYVPEGSKDSYKEADYWNNYSEIIADYNFAE